MRTWIRSFRWEMYKITHRLSSYVGLALCAAFCALIMVVFAYSQFRALKHSAQNLVADPMTFVNGYFFSTFVLYFGFKTLLPLLAGVIPGAQLAGEAKDGTLRAILCRPPSRFAVFFTKLAAAYLWLVATVFALIALSLMIGLIALGTGDFLVFVWEFRHYGPWFASEGDWIWIFIVTGLGASVGLFMIVAFSLALSACTDNPVVAYVGALGLYFVSSVVQRLPEQIVDPLIRRLMPTSHTEFWHELYWLFSPTPGRFNEYRFWSDLKWCGMYSVFCIAIGLVVFLSRDIKT